MAKVTLKRVYDGNSEHDFHYLTTEGDYEIHRQVILDSEDLPPSRWEYEYFVYRLNAQGEANMVDAAELLRDARDIVIRDREDRS